MGSWSDMQMISFFFIEENELPVLMSKSFKLVIDSSDSYFLAVR